MSTHAQPPIDFSSLPVADLCDDGGVPILAQVLVTAHVADAVAQALAANYGILPTGGLTSAIGSFTYDTARASGFAGLVALRPKGALEPEMVPASTPLTELLSCQMSIDPEQGLVSAGVGLTITQINAALATALGPTARVLVDLTSVGSAFVGGVVATGAMGPMRMPPSSSLHALAVMRGPQVEILTGAGIAEFEGLQGWTGMAVAVQFRFFHLPASEFGIVLPVQGTDVDTMAGLLAYLEPWTRISLPEAGGKLGDDGQIILNGVELVSRSSLEEFVQEAQDPARSKAQGLLQSCEYAGADMLACLTGWSDQSVDDVLFGLMDPETETIGGVMIEYGIGFSSGAEMETFRAIREGAPDLARTKARVRPDGQVKPWTTSTDINVRVPADSGVISDVLSAYADYRTAIRKLEKDMAVDGLRVELAAYGHLSPYGIDPHHRVTVFAAEGQEAAQLAARQAVLALKRTLIEDLLHATRHAGCLITGGEKGAPSLVELVRAGGGESGLPADLQQRVLCARQAVLAALPNFAFRAPAELRDSRG